MDEILDNGGETPDGFVEDILHIDEIETICGDINVNKSSGVENNSTDIIKDSFLGIPDIYYIIRVL